MSTSIYWNAVHACICISAYACKHRLLPFGITIQRQHITPITRTQSCFFWFSSGVCHCAIEVSQRKWACAALFLSLHTLLRRIWVSGRERERKGREGGVCLPFCLCDDSEECGECGRLTSMLPWLYLLYFLERILRSVLFCLHHQSVLIWTNTKCVSAFVYLCLPRVMCLA